MLVESNLTASQKGLSDGTLKILPFYFHFPIESRCGLGLHFINRIYTITSHIYVWKLMDPAMNLRIIIVQAAVSVFTENSDFL